MSEQKRTEWSSKWDVPPHRWPVYQEALGSLGVNLSYLAKERGYSLSLLAQKTRLSRRMLEYIMAGKRAPSLAALVNIAEVLGVGETMWWLLLAHSDFKKKLAGEASKT